MTQYRKDALENGYYYHIYNQSIAKYVIFNNSEDYLRFIEIFNLYKFINFNFQYSKFIRLDIQTQNQIIENLKSDQDVLVRVIAFCIMPTHIHFLLRQIADNGISKYMSKILNAYSKYFNIKHRRSGPLWAGRFKSVLVDNDEQLLHLTRYIHLNPTSAGIVKKPQDWSNSSYNKYIDPAGKCLGELRDIFSMSPKEYKKFTMNHKDYQREISKIKKIIFD